MADTCIIELTLKELREIAATLIASERINGHKTSTEIWTKILAAEKQLNSEQESKNRAQCLREENI